MLFNSIEYLVFLPATFIFYWFVFSKNQNLQNIFMLISSYVFYGWWDWRFLFLIFLTTIVDFLIGISIYSTNSLLKKKIYLWFSIIFNLGVLGLFKYYNFFVESFFSLFNILGTAHNVVGGLYLILPIGISFYTFQTMSYSLDIYYGRLRPTQNFISFAMFVSFFPQLVAGPIERASNLLPQIFRKRIFNYEKAVDGIRLILWGMFKKIVIADSLGWRVDYCFQNYSSLDGGTLLLGMIYFSYQIYCDFSGYSDIAVGTAKLFGFELLSNFKYPFFSRSITEFWSKWHISLSSWFKDYFYLPLILNFRYGGLLSIIFITSLTFTIIGLWHGANYTFIIFGMINALYLIPGIIWRKTYRKEIFQSNNIQTTLIELFLVIRTFFYFSFSLIFFRSNNTTEAFEYIFNMILNPSIPATNRGGIIIIFIFIIFELLFLKDERKVINFKNSYLRWVFYFGLSFFCFSHFNFFEEINFIYFQF